VAPCCAFKWFHTFLHNLVIIKRQSVEESYHQKFEARVLCVVSVYFKHRYMYCIMEILLDDMIFVWFPKH
jgi:hypothetical protein